MRGGLSRCWWGVGVVTAVVLGVGGCTSENPTEVVSSSGPVAGGRGPVHKVVVVAMLKREDLRRQMENEFQGQLRAAGVEVVPGYGVWPGAEKVSGEQLRQEAQRVGADGVVVAGLVREGTETVAGPAEMVGNRMGYGAGYLALSYEDFQQPPEQETEWSAVMQTTVYDASGARPIWSARTETVLMTDPVGKEIPGFVRTVVGRMEKDGVVGKEK